MFFSEILKNSEMLFGNAEMFLNSPDCSGKPGAAMAKKRGI
jgi:hypothetical protein